MRKCALLVLVVVFGWSSGAWGLPANNPITNGLVAAYEFSGNADDVSGNENHGVVNGATLVPDRFGNPDAAYSFDGEGDYISTPIDSNALGISFSVWFKPDTLDGARSIIDSDQCCTYGHSLVIGYFGNSNLNFQYHDGHFDSGFSPLVNEWTHAAVTISTAVRIYVDGDLVSTHAYSPATPLDGSNFRFGKKNYIHPQWFSGTIDDGYFYDRVLSGAEIAALAAIPEPSTALLLGVGLAGLGMRRTRC